MLLLSRLLSVHIVQEAPGVQYWTWEHCAFSWTPASSTKQWQNKGEISDADLEQKLLKKLTFISIFTQLSAKGIMEQFCPRRIRKAGIACCGCSQISRESRKGAL